MARIFYCNSGTEANETALKMAKAHGHAISPDKFEIVSLDNSFHGRTIGALSVTGQESYRRDFEPLMPGVHFVPRNDITALEQVVNERTAGIILELVQGEGGIYPMTEAYIRKARELADRYNAILIFDEIQCGVGRTGTYFAYQLLDPPVMPDVMTAAKPVACGLALGVVAANERAAAGLGKGKHGTTFGGGPLVCRVGLEFFDILDGLLPHISEVGSYFRMRLTELSRRYSFIKEVRGVGLMIGVELEFPGKQTGARLHRARRAAELHARLHAAHAAALHHHGAGSGPRDYGAEARVQEREAAGARRLQQIVAAGFFQTPDQFADFLRAAAVGDQQGVGRIDHDQVLHAQQRHQLAFGVDVVAGARFDDGIRTQRVALGVALLQFVDGVPTADVVPADIARRNAGHVGRAFHHGVVDRNVVALREGRGQGWRKICGW